MGSEKQLGINSLIKHYLFGDNHKNKWKSLNMVKCHPKRINDFIQMKLFSDYNKYLKVSYHLHLLVSAEAIMYISNYLKWTSGPKHYENAPFQIHWKFYHQKMAIFQIKNSDIFHISAQNIDCGYSLEPPRRGGSNEYAQSMFWAEIRKIMYTPVNPNFTI